MRLIYLSNCSSPKKSLHPVSPESHPAAARSLKLLAKIPRDAEAVIVLVGKRLDKNAASFVFLGGHSYCLKNKKDYSMHAFIINSRRQLGFIHTRFCCILSSLL